jgi:hypothetical protein
MAETSNSIPAPCANPSEFNPADWLSRFKAVGGWWVLTSGDKVALGWLLDGYTTAQNVAASLIFNELVDSPDQGCAVKEHLRASIGGARHG